MTALHSAGTEQCAKGEVSVHEDQSYAVPQT